MNIESLHDKDQFNRKIFHFLSLVSNLEDGKYNTNKQELLNYDERVILEPHEQGIQAISDLLYEVKKPEFTEYIETLTEGQQKTIKDAIIRAEIYLSAFKQ